MNIPPLTPRQTEVIGLRGDGLSNKEIGARLGLTEGTVKEYFNQIVQKTGVNVRGLVGYMARQNALDVLRKHSVAIKDWKLKHEQTLSPEATAELNAVIMAMLFDWAKL